MKEERIIIRIEEVSGLLEGRNEHPVKWKGGKDGKRGHDTEVAPLGPPLFESSQS